MNRRSMYFNDWLAAIPHTRGDEPRSRKGKTVHLVATTPVVALLAL